MHPLLILVVGMATILVAIIVVRLNAFLALTVAAILVSLLAPGGAAVKVARVADAFGRTAGSIGIVIALAAVIGSAMLESGAADRIVRAFLALLGEERGATALCATGWVLSTAVFFDTVFYLLVPLARSMHGRTGRHYLKYLVALAAGAAATHTLVPPTPGPLAVAGALGVDLGTMVLVGMVIALPAAAAGLLYAGWIDRRMPVTPAPAPGEAGLAAPGPAERLPALVPALLPIALPVLLISANTIVAALRPAGTTGGTGALAALASVTAVVGNPNLALLLSAAVALWLYARQRGAGRDDVARLVERSLMGGGVIILITAAGGGFGATLQAAGIGQAIQQLAMARGAGAGLVFLGLAFSVAALIKIAQGSSTVAMITTAGMLAAMLASAPPLPFNPVYIGTATAGGALVGTWMNDSGFWVFSKLGGVSEVEALKSWTPVSAIVGVTTMAVTVLLALLVPLR